MVRFSFNSFVGLHHIQICTVFEQQKFNNDDLKNYSKFQKSRSISSFFGLSRPVTRKYWTPTVARTYSINI